MISSSFLRDKDFSSDECSLIRHCDGYLANVDGKSILVVSNGHYYEIPYTTRWSNSYKKKMVAKMYGVEEYCRRSGKAIITLLTLTGYQDGPTSVEAKGKETTREELFSDLKKGWKLLSNIIAKTWPDLKYVWVTEPHKSGYPHMHVAIFGYISPEMRERLRLLWSEKYKVGSAEHGIDFSVKSVKESIQSIRNYLMKYISKGIGAGGSKTWTAEEWLYHATAWKHRHRYIGMSQVISQYCTAYKLRFKHRKYILDLFNGEHDPGLPEIPVDIIGLKKIIQRFEWKAPHDELPPIEERWSCTFIMSRYGTITPVRKSANFDDIVPPEIVKWINYMISLVAEYADDFLRIARPQWTFGLETSKQVEDKTPIRNTQA